MASRFLAHGARGFLPASSQLFRGPQSQRAAFGTRVFVSGIPAWATWHNLKDHFRVAGEVVYASVSVDAGGRPKGVGIVEFEDEAGASNAIAIMREHPMRGCVLYVREDVQDRNKRKPAAYSTQWRPPHESHPAHLAAHHGGDTDRRRSAADPNATRPSSFQSHGVGASGSAGGVGAGQWERCNDDEFAVSVEACGLIEGYLAERDQCRWVPGLRDDLSAPVASDDADKEMPPGCAIQQCAQEAR